MENIKVPQNTLVYPLSGSIVIRIIRNREVLLFCKSGKHVQNLNTPLNHMNVVDQGHTVGDVLQKLTQEIMTISRNISTVFKKT